MSMINKGMIIKRMPWHSNMTEKNHLGEMMRIKPEIFETKMTQLFSSLIYSGNSLTALIGNNVKTISSDEWEWELRGASTKPSVVVDVTADASSATPGKFKTPISVVLDDNSFLPGDVLAPNGNKDYTVRVISKNSAPNGNGYLYTFRLMNDNDAAYLPAQYLKVGTQYAKLFSQYGEASEQSGSTQFAGTISLKSRLSRYRKQYKVTGDVDEEVLAVAMPDSNGKYHTAWIKYMEVEYWKQWYHELDLGKWYSRSTSEVTDANGRPLYTGPGVDQIITESGYVEDYTDFTATLIEEFLMDIFYGRVKPGSSTRNLKAFTGEYGFLLFHRAMQDWINANGNITIVDSHIMSSVKSEMNANALQVGYQYVKYLMPNGTSLELVHNPIQDDRSINFELDPVTGYPIESMKFYFMDFSGDMGESNISIVKKARSTKLGYVNGLTSPFGPVNNGAMAHSGDYYEMHVQTKEGIWIKDPTRTGILRLRRS